MDNNMRAQLLNITALATQYCSALETVGINADDGEDARRDFINTILNLLPKIYVEFLDLSPVDDSLEETYFGQYVDEDYYDSIRRRVEMLMGPDDVFLETFEEDMKYSDTPIASSVSECLADLFQPLYNFISVVKDTDGEKITEAYLQCREDFDAYWSQTLCNVLRALNHLR